MSRARLYLCRVPRLLRERRFQILNLGFYKVWKMIKSQIDGAFSGWEGETLVKLVNGQVWQQAEYWYHYHYSYMPSVTITTDGGYKMLVEGMPKAIRVERLK